MESMLSNSMQNISFSEDNHRSSPEGYLKREREQASPNTSKTGSASSKKSRDSCYTASEKPSSQSNHNSTFGSLPPMFDIPPDSNQASTPKKISRSTNKQNDCPPYIEAINSREYQPTAC